MKALFSISVALFVASGCAAPKPIARTLKGGASTTGDANAQGSANPMVQNTEAALTGLPSYCVASAPTDGKVCISCDRVASEGASKVEFKDLCFDAKPEFNPKLHCGVEGEGSISKSFFCQSKESDKKVFDVSIAAEKAADIFPLILLAVKTGLSEKLKADSNEQKIADEIMTFASEKFPLVLAGKDLDKIADETFDLAMKHAAKPLSEPLKETIRKNVKEGLKTFYLELANTKELSLTKAIAAVLKFAKTIPEEQLGNAKKYLSGAELATHLTDKKAVVEPIVTKFGSIIGITSFEDLVAQVKAADAEVK